MAKSKNGGSRAYIRGRIGSDVYSVGKNGKGEKQQVVRSLAEQVSNPRTQNQMFGRMIMSTVMQAVSGLSAIIDHSFDSVPKGQPSISEFIRMNYALVKADALAHPASGNKFGLNEYQQKGAQHGPYVIASGSAIVPASVTTSMVQMSINLSSETLTVGGLKAALGLSADGYLTFVQIGDNGVVDFVRVKLTTTLADSTAITGSNVASLFTFEGTYTPEVDLDETTIGISARGGSEIANVGIIVSEKVDGSWIHNNCTLSESTLSAGNSDAVLPTYPTGTEMFLNGGDL